MLYKSVDDFLSVIEIVDIAVLILADPFHNFFLGDRVLAVYRLVKDHDVSGFVNLPSVSVAAPLPAIIKHVHFRAVTVKVG